MGELILGLTCVVETAVIIWFLRNPKPPVSAVNETNVLEEGLQPEATYTFAAVKSGNLGPSMPRMDFVVNGYELSNIIRYCKDLEKR